MDYNIEAIGIGNVRVVIKKGANGLAEIIQQKGYYAFGMEISQFSSGTGTSKNWYNGKEIQDDFGLYWYDYGARFYDPALGRWHSVDNKAEKYYSNTPYAYAANNPIRFIDPDGNEIVDANGKRITYTSSKGWSPNATTDVKTFYTALMLTSTDAKQWDKAYNSDRKIEMKIVGELNDPKTGQPVFGLTHKSITKDKNFQYKVKDNMKIEISLTNIENSMNDENLELNIRQAIGATAGHEIEHTTKENTDINIHNIEFPFAQKDVEKEPSKIGQDIRNESREANRINKPMKPIEGFVKTNMEN